MNIFVLNEDPKVSAELMCDKHVVKMILESAQMLCSPFPNGDAPYKRTHFNHPCSKWTRESVNNYEWLLTHAYALLEEYLDRYGKIHKSLDAIAWCDDHYHNLNLPDIKLSPFAQAMPDEYKNKNAVIAYQTYYVNDKKYFAKWKNKEVPNFMVDNSLLLV
jgi:hypothetical protein